MIGTIKDLLASKKFLAALTAVIVYVAGRFGFDVDTAVLDRIFAALLVYVGGQGLADIGKSAAVLHTTLAWDMRNLPPAPDAAEDAASPAVRTAGTVSLVLSLLLIGGAGLVLHGCATVRPAASAGAAAFLDCESGALKATAAELVPLLEQAVLSVIRGDGTIDTTDLRAAAAPLKSDLGRCALAGAIAAVTAPEPPAASSARLATVAPSRVDAAALRASFTSVRGELGWAPMRVAGQSGLL